MYRCTMTFTDSQNKVFKTGNLIDKFTFENLFSKEQSNFKPINN
jgi:hypothetical protein